MKQFADSFALLPEASTIAARLTEAVPHFAHLREARVLFIASQRQPMLHGHPCQAFVGRPHVQGPFAPLFDWFLSQFARDLFGWEDPDFVIVIDVARWQGHDDEHREWLVYHELRHIEQKTDPETGIPKFSKDDDRPMWKLVPHDAEFFFDEVERYGPEVTGHVEATVALASGATAAADRRAAAAREGGRGRRRAAIQADDVHASVRSSVRPGAH